jgi:hypothetical protein
LVVYNLLILDCSFHHSLSSVLSLPGPPQHQPVLNLSFSKEQGEIFLKCTSYFSLSPMYLSHVTAKMHTPLYRYIK